MLLYSRSYLEQRKIMKVEYFVLVLPALLGIFVLIAANSMLTVYIGVELLALSVYALADLVLVDGNVVVDREKPARRSDFELGILGGVDEVTP